ncbi:GNAT family protein [Psychrobacillus sp. BL-248-WT-3]|uniref:GNAT family N-acetyltransferase n=1 Tax=Psychrobacillus sp. BL-248-WT-3 TaxID=2725306 RepID=UPI00146EFBA9|nr:GNAT family N-acetyltransferase [Psychrobacillus sp. BL-248-WT-3]
MAMKELYLETDRLILRTFNEEDYESWSNGFNNRLPSQYKYDEGYKIMEKASNEWFSDWIKGFNKALENDEMYIMGIFRKEDGVNIGKVELITILRMDYQWAMMGYSIHNQYWKKGYGVESVREAKKYFFDSLKFQRIELHINVDNRPFETLAKRAGFKYECTREKFSMEEEEWVDFLIYYALRE